MKVSFFGLKYRDKSKDNIQSSFKSGVAVAGIEQTLKTPVKQLFERREGKTGSGVLRQSNGIKYSFYCLS